MRDVTVAADPDAVAHLVAGRFLTRMAAAQARGQVPQVVLTGGTVATLVHRAIAHRAADHTIDWSRIEFWFGDERFVDSRSLERNCVQARADLLDLVGATRVHEVLAADQTTDVRTAAAEYADRLRATTTGEFDLVMLGMGPDGHVASLFPGAQGRGTDDQTVLAVLDSPKPPPQRVTFTFPTLNRSRAVWFLVTGAEKAPAVRRAWAFEGTEDETPARGIVGPSITWFVDEAARGS